LKTFEVIKKNSEFQRVFEKGHSIFSRSLVVYFLPNSALGFRCGFCVGKKLGSAVTRNHIKRILREAVRLTKEAVPAGFDVVFIAKNRMLKSDLYQAIVEINQLFAQIKKEGEMEDSR
jgi:ribonuclease P protein component